MNHLKQKLIKAFKASLENLNNPALKIVFH